MRFLFIATFLLTLSPKAFTLKCRVCKTQVGNLTLIGACANATDNGVIEDCQPPNDQCWFTNGSKYVPCLRNTEKLIFIANGVTLCKFVLRKARNVRNSGMGSMSCWSAPKMVQYQIWSLPNMVINPKSMKITVILADN